MGCPTRGRGRGRFPFWKAVHCGEITERAGAARRKAADGRDEEGVVGGRGGDEETTR